MSNFSGLRSGGAKLILTIFLLLTIAACFDKPLEDDCGTARETFRKFYSLHFAGDMNFSEATLAQSRNSLTPELFRVLAAERQKLAAANAADYPDPFTGEKVFPTTFRIGGCRIVEPNKADVDSILIWKDKTIEQKAVDAILVKQNEKWLVDDVITRDENRREKSLKKSLEINNSK